MYCQLHNAAKMGQMTLNVDNIYTQTKHEASDQINAIHPATNDV